MLTDNKNTFLNILNTVLFKVCLEALEEGALVW